MCRRCGARELNSGDSLPKVGAKTLDHAEVKLLIIYKRIHGRPN